MNKDCDHHYFQHLLTGDENEVNGELEVILVGKEREGETCSIVRSPFHGQKTCPLGECAVQ